MGIPGHLATAVLLFTGTAAFAQPAGAPPDGARQTGEPPRVAVVVTGRNASSSGSLLRSLEGRLVALPQLRLRTSEQCVALLWPSSGGEVAASDPLGERVAEQLPRIARAYYDDRLADAEAALALAESGVPRRNGLATLRLLLWRAAIALAKGDRPAAESAAKAALAIAPDVEADGRIHPPALQELLVSLKPKVGRSASLAVVAFPAGAVVRIDDRLAEGRVAVTPGRHLVVVSSRGYRPVEMAVNVTNDATSTISLPVAYGAAEPGSESELAALARALDVESLVVVDADPGKPLRVGVVGPVPAPAPPASFEADAAGQAALADWIEARFKPEIARAAALRDWTWTVTGGPAFGARQRSLSADGAEGYDAGFAGYGPSLSVRVAPGRWRLEADAYSIRYALGTFETSFPDGRAASTGGGETIAARVAAGWAFGSGPTGREDRAELVPFAGIAWEEHRSEDLRDERGELGFLPSHQRIALEVGVQAGVPLGRLGRGPARVFARGAVLPVSTWEETPAGSTGTAPRADVGFGAGAGVRWEPGRWIVTAEVTGELRTVRFRGSADLPADPPLRHGRVREGVQAFTVGFGRAF